MTDYQRYNTSDDVNNGNHDLDEDLFEEADQLVFPTNLYVLIFVLWPLAFATILGNALAIWAYTTDSKIRSNISNRFIFYLSISDFTVGFVSLPLNNVWLHFGYWPLGEAVCKAWLIVDYASCYISVLAILLLSFDRCWWVFWPMRYKGCQTGRKATILILSTALFAFTFYTIPILFWSTWVGEDQIDYSVSCEPENITNVTYGIIFALCETVLPAIAISILNILVYHKIRKVCHTRGRSIRGRGGQFKPRVRKQGTCLSQPGKENEQIYPRNSEECVALNPSGDNILTISNIDDMNIRKSAGDGHHGDKRGCKSTMTNASGHSGGHSGSSQDSRQQDRYVNGYKKAGKMLACMVAVFMICWTPFNIALLASAICPNECIRNITWEAVNYLLWANSTVNPLLYVLTNERYKRRMLSVFQVSFRRKASFRLKLSTST